MKEKSIKRMGQFKMDILGAEDELAGAQIENNQQLRNIIKQ